MVAFFWALSVSFLLIPVLLSILHSASGLRLPLPTVLFKQGGQLDQLLASIPESELDANRSVVVLGGERIFVPKRIPRLSRADKRRLVAEKFAREGIPPPKQFYETDWSEGGKPRRMGHKRRRALLLDRPWRNQYIVRRKYRPRINVRLQAKNTAKCPERLDAVTEAHNNRIYVFAEEMVYEVWRDGHGLQQRQAYALHDLFPDGPRRVTAAFSNHKSGVTVLLDWRTVYRFRWDKRHRRFYMARNSPSQLPEQADFQPRVGFQWKDGHLILANKEKFTSYDPYWNLATFSSSQVKEYFPNVDMASVIGVARHGRDAYLLMTREGHIQVYDMRKHTVNMEFPLSVRHFIACLPNGTSTH